MVALVTILAVVVALLAVLVAGLLRSHAEIVRALHELGADLDPDSARRRPAQAAARPSRSVPRTAADVTGETPEGDAVSIGVTGAPHATLLAFLTSGCTTCAGFWEAFADPDTLTVPGDARLVVVTKSPTNEVVAQVQKLAAPDLTVVMSNAAWEAYDTPVAPYFVYVDGSSGKVVGEGAATTWAHVVSLLTQAIEDAGLEGDTGGRRGRRRARSGAAREARIDRDLLAAGLRPGDPAFYPSRQTSPQPDAAADNGEP
ncbi:MAG: hypothetical protein ACRDY4_09720 [Acidimicrobiia bacterium]